MKTKTLIAAILSVTTASVVAVSYQNKSPEDWAGIEEKPVVIEPKPSILIANNPSLTNLSAPQSVNQKPKVELVFALDTTGSMGGLIQAAKDKIWSIASTMASAHPAPEISIGLVAYRDRGDEYITKRIALSQDLDAVYTELLQLQAAGGGDGPESVNAALFDAVHLMNWSQDPNSYKVIFLVGDAPGHDDYQDDVPFAKSIAQARKNGIVVNTIQAGSNQNMVKAWQKIAALGQGDSFQVGQQGSAIAIKTPFDEAIVAASRRYEDTRIFYGKEEEQKAQQQKIEVTGSRMKESASISSLARRAKFNASESGEKNFAAGKELVQAIENDELALRDIPESEMPLSMRVMAPAEREKFVEQKSKERQVSKEELLVLNEKRDNYIKMELGKSAKSKDSLDEKLFTTLKKQAAEKGLDYSAAESSY